MSSPYEVLEKGGGVTYWTFNREYTDIFVKTILGIVTYWVIYMGYGDTLGNPYELWRHTWQSKWDIGIYWAIHIRYGNILGNPYGVSWHTGKSIGVGRGYNNILGIHMKCGDILRNPYELWGMGTYWAIQWGSVAVWRLRTPALMDVNIYPVSNILGLF